MNRTLGKYRIEYRNGAVKFMDLISQSDFENIYKPAKDKIADLIADKKNVPADVYKERVKEVKALKKDLKEWFGDNFFTNGSPIYKAIDTGVLELDGYRYPCTVTKVENESLILNEVE